MRVIKALPAKPVASKRLIRQDRRIALFTSVDDVLVNTRGELGRNSSTVKRLHAAGIPVVPVTDLTLDEMRPLAAELNLRDPMIIEAGGAIARLSGSEWSVEQCGPDIDTLLDVVREVEERSAASLLLYSVLPETEASRLSGHSGERLRASMNRRFSVPFVIETGRIRDVSTAAESLGFVVIRGPRFLHLCERLLSAAIVARLRCELGCNAAVAIGGSPLDTTFMKQATHAIVVPRAQKRVCTDLISCVPNAQIAAAPAPDGWSDAVERAFPDLFRCTSRSGRSLSAPQSDERIQV